MAIYHFSAKMVSRSSGKSVIAKAAYNAREALTEERTGEVKDFHRAKGLLFSGLYTPAQAPKWAHDRAQLWNAADAAEKRKDAQVAREYQMALPHELTDEQRRYLVQDFVKENFTRKGYAADVCIHAPDRDGDQRNYHAHILVTDRRLQANGFAPDKKERQQTATARKAELEGLREKWEHLANRHLERHGHDARIDRRSLEDQGSDREPTQHLGPTATQLEREGKESERGTINRDIAARNSEREDLKEELQKSQEAQRCEEQVLQQTREEESQQAPAPHAQEAPAPHEQTGDAAHGGGRIESKLSAIAADVCEGIGNTIGSFFSGIANAISRPVPEPPKRENESKPKREKAEALEKKPAQAPRHEERKGELSPAPAARPLSAREMLQRQAARQRALRNISASVKRGEDLNPADLHALPPAELERLRQGGDEYLKRLVQRFEREREERGRERER